MFKKFDILMKISDIFYEILLQFFFSNKAVDPSRFKRHFFPQTIMLYPEHVPHLLLKSNNALIKYLATIPLLNFTIYLILLYSLILKIICVKYYKLCIKPLA